MSVLRLADTRRFDVSPLPSSCGPVRQLYENLLGLPQPQSPQQTPAAQSFLEEHLRQARNLPCDLPLSPRDLPLWMQKSTTRVTQAYGQYLQMRKQGGQRRYFSSRAHALYFLRAVAPTKLVDGAWLYGLLPHWREARLLPLVLTYLEELGDGVPAQNHVLIYKKLLIAHGCDDLTSLGDDHYVQGALQLALGQLAAHYLPEVIGFNLGYEQLPLHLLITAYELEELGIDPYYFKLHITIDNAATGHAHKAVQAVLDNLPVIGDADAFYRRVEQGYRLNDIGAGSMAVVASFDLERELLLMLERKRQFAGNVHSDYCRIEGHTVNEWLNGPQAIGLFLAALQKRGWIRRHADPQLSRFWQLMNGEKAAMFGVFTEYEQQLMYDWIAGDWLAEGASERPHPLATPVKQRLQAKQYVSSELLDMPLIAAAGASVRNRRIENAIDAEQRELEHQLERLNAAQNESRLITLASPALHATPAGLTATRRLSSLLR